MYVWDMWFALDRSKTTFHAFCLQAPETILPDDRHLHASIGHATADYPLLTHWRDEGTALFPSESPAADDSALWTGSVIYHKNTYYMAYTGLSKKTQWRQTICLATSSDLYTWKKYEDNPILEADSKCYKMSDTKTVDGDIFAFRDPYLFEDMGSIYMLIAANTNVSSPYSGCVAIAKLVSDDFTKWQLLPPLCAPGIYKEMEVPQLIMFNNIYYLFFSTWPEKINPTYTNTQGNLHCFVADELFGKYTPIPTTSPSGVYAIRLIDRKDSVFRGIGWLTQDKNGQFLGGFSDPLYLKISGDSIQV